MIYKERVPDEGSLIHRVSLVKYEEKKSPKNLIMKFFVAVLAAAAVVAFASAGTSPDAGRYDGPIYEMTAIEEPTGSEDANALEPHARERRFTCDVFSFSSQWFTPNHSACAMKCIGMRRRGGSCRNGICVCRNSRW